MSIRYLFALLSLMCLFQVGCGGGTEPRPKTAEIASQAKQQIDRTISQINQSPDSAATELGLLMESLEAYARDYGGPFKEMLETAKSVQSGLGAKPDQSKLESELGKLTSAANKLVETAK